MAVASIDLDGMAELITRLETASYCLHAAQWSLRGKADRLDVSTSTLTRIEQIATWADDELPGLRRRLNLAIAADAQRPQSLRGTPVQIEEPVLTIAEANALGTDLAGRLGAAGLCDDAEAFARLVEEVAAYCGDPDVMTALVDELGAQGLLDVMSRAAVPPQHPVATIDTDVRASLLVSLKAGLDTADTMWSGARSAAFATALVAASTGDPSCSGLSYLLHESYYSDAFLSAAAEAIDAFDRTGWDGQPGQWNPDTGQGQYWDLYFPDGASAAYQDPVISLMTALALQPEVALGFFNPDRGGDVALARAEHYITNRAWADDDNALAQALDRAATQFHTTDAPVELQEQSAWVASAAIYFLAQREANGNLLTDSSRIGDAANDSLAHLLSEYVLDINAVANGYGSRAGDPGLGTYPAVGEGETADSPGLSAPWLVGVPVRARFGQRELNTVLSELLLDDSAMERIGESAAALADVTIQSGLNAWNTSEDRSAPGAYSYFTGAAGENAALMGYLLGNVEVGSTAVGRQADERKQLLADLFAAALRSGTAGDPIIKSLQGVAIGESVDLVASEVTTGESNAQAEASLAQLIVEQRLILEAAHALGGATDLQDQFDFDLATLTDPDRGLDVIQAMSNGTLGQLGSNLSSTITDKFGKGCLKSGADPTLDGISG